MYDNVGAIISAMAVKKERERIIDEIEKIDINSPSQLNAVGFKLLVMNIINQK